MTRKIGLVGKIALMAGSIAGSLVSAKGYEGLNMDDPDEMERDYKSAKQKRDEGIVCGIDPTIGKLNQSKQRKVLNISVRGYKRVFRGTGGALNSIMIKKVMMSPTKLNFWQLQFRHW
jgi:hypothetical protein